MLLDSQISLSLHFLHMSFIHFRNKQSNLNKPLLDANNVVDELAFQDPHGPTDLPASIRLSYQKNLETPTHRAALKPSRKSITYLDGVGSFSPVYKQPPRGNHTKTILWCLF